MTIKTGDDILLARAYIRSFSELFRGIVEGTTLAIAGYDMLRRVKSLSTSITLNLDVNLEAAPQKLHVIVHGFDVHIPSFELRERVLDRVEYQSQLREMGCEFVVQDRPGFGMVIEMTIAASDSVQIISKNTLMERIPENANSPGELLISEFRYSDRAMLTLAKHSQHGGAASVAAQHAMMFLHHELRQAHRETKTLRQNYGPYSQLARVFQKSIEEIRGGIASIEKSGAAGLGALGPIKETEKKLAALAAKLEYVKRGAPAGIDTTINAEEVRLGEIFAMVNALFAPLVVKKGIDLTFVQPQGLPHMKVDKMKLARVLHHLLDNAVKFTETGTIKVHAEKSSYKNELTIVVEDSGIGISQDNQNLLMGDADKSKQTPDIVLSGLAIARKLIEAMGGTMALSSLIGVGSKFSITLPMEYRPPQAAKPAAIEQAVAPPPAPVTREEASGQMEILIVEDDEATQFLITRILTPEYKCLFAASADEAYAILGKSRIKFIYMDIALHGSVDGIELTRQLRASPEWKDIPIVALTSFTQDLTRGEALCAGVDDYLTKPINRDELLGKIKEHMRPV